MLPGFGGHLVSELFLENAIDARPAPDGDRLGGGEVREPSLRLDETVDLADARRTLIDWRRRCSVFGPSSSVRTLLEAAAAPLLEAVGFEPPVAIDRADATVAATLRPANRQGSVAPTGVAARQPDAPTGRANAVALLVVGWGESLDRFWRAAVTQALRRSAAWCLVFNGTHLRLVDAGRLYTRRYLEFDIDLAIDDDRSFIAFWSVMRAPILTGDAGCAAPLHAIVDASERHASGVCRSLRGGVLIASGEVIGALVGRRARLAAGRPLDDTFEQALTIVYRILFLLFAEARGLVPLWHPVYRDSYSIDALRTTAERAEGSAGLWDALRAIARLAHAGCRAGDLNVTPFNGRLFAPARTPLADRNDLDDNAARRAVLALSTRQSAEGGGLERIAYRDLGVEQLGAVYETLLDYQPRVVQARNATGRGQGGPERPALPRGASDAPTSARVTLEPGSGLRKSTGTFYTPQPIADYIVRRTLGPLVRDAPPERILQLRIVDPAMGSGAFLVAACRYLANAYELAVVRAGGCHPSDIGDGERVAIRRTIAERCLYGVDLNPMAVQLARLSLWLTTLAADRPLTFLDHHLQAGDSLLGAWLTSLRHSRRDRRTRRVPDGSTLPLFEETDVCGALKQAVPVRFSLESIPGDTIDQVRAKERALAALNRRDAELAKWKRVADLWCGLWFQTPDRAVPPAAFAELADLILSGRCTLPAATAERCLRDVDAIADARRFFHWELEFPEVFFGADGQRLPAPGFDAVIGNPPWDMIRADAGPADTRARARDDIAAVLRFTRDAGVYAAQSDGHANRYQLFLERAIALTRERGRIGLVVPSGLATDHGSERLRRLLLTRCNVDAIVGFDNSRAVFPIHRSVRFLLLTASAGSPTGTIACRFGERDPACLEAIGEEPAASSPWFPVRLTPEFLQRVSGNGLAIPDVRATTDLAIVERSAALFPPLGSDAGWAARFGRELNATDDRAHFRPPGSGLPVLEGKQIEAFRVDLAAARHAIAAADARRLLDPARYERPRLGYRDVASATNRLTLIAALLPADCVSTHTVFCLRTPLPLQSQYFLCGLFNSFVVNYLVRLRVTTHVTTGIVEGLPIPRPDAAPRAFREIAAIARGLTRCPDPVAFARLQALVAHLYQLSAAEFEHILGTFPLISIEERDAARMAFAR